MPLLHAVAFRNQCKDSERWEHRQDRKNGVLSAWLCRTESYLMQRYGKV